MELGGYNLRSFLGNEPLDPRTSLCTESLGVHMNPHESKAPSNGGSSLPELSLCGWVQEGVSQTLESAGRELNPEQLRPALEAQVSHEEELLAVPGVVAVGTGVAETGDIPAIHVFFNVTAAGAMRPEQRSRSASTAFLSKSWRPTRLSRSTAARITEGSFLSRCPWGYRRGMTTAALQELWGSESTGLGIPMRVGYITNNHVAAAGGANLCPNRAPLGEDQFQPGLFDTLCEVRNSLHWGAHREFIPIVFGGGANEVDAAFVRSDRTQVNKRILDIGRPSPSILSPRVGQTVQKSGRTTGYTKGQVNTINATVFVDYGPCGSARFVSQAIITRVVVDSRSSQRQRIPGSPVLTLGTDEANRFKPVGLLFAGSSSFTVINPIEFVLDSLGVQIDTQ